MGYITEDEMIDVYRRDAERKANEALYEMRQENMPISARTLREVHNCYERDDSRMERYARY